MAFCQQLFANQLLSPIAAAAFPNFAARCQPEACAGHREHRQVMCYFEMSDKETSMDEKQQPQQPGQMQIKADEKELQGLYSNLMMIHHNAEEFTLNFVYIFPNGNQGKLLSSVIVSPGHAKRIWRALGENLSRYEAQFGTIKETPEGSNPTPPVGFVQ